MDRVTLTRRGLFRALCGAAAAPAIAEALPQLPLKPQLPKLMWGTTPTHKIESWTGRMFLKGVEVEYSAWMLT
jgi:hypothetical protein